MAELDDLLTDRVSAQASRRATPPPFAELRSRGVRRRRVRRAAVMGAAAAATVVTVAGLQLTGLDRAGQPVDVPRPTPTAPATPEELTAAEVIDHPEAQLRRIVVAPDDRDTRAALWSLCVDSECGRSTQAIAVTSDGFESRVEIPVPARAYPLITALGEGFFYVGWNQRNQVVVTSDGTTTPVRIGDVPVDERADVVRTPSPHAPFIELDAASGRARRLPLPDGVRDLVEIAGGRLLSAVSDQLGEGAAIWFEPDQQMWHTERLLALNYPLFRPVATQRPDTMAILEGSDGATLFPFLQVHRSLDGGVTWQTIDVRTDPTAYLGTSAVLPDGRLLVDIAAWSDQRINRPSARPVGLHVSDGLDWSALSPVDVGDPFTTGNSDQRDYEVVAMEATEGGVAVYVRGIEDGRPVDTVHVSHDAGSSWQELDAR